MQNNKENNNLTAEPVTSGESLTSVELVMTPYVNMFLEARKGNKIHQESLIEDMEIAEDTEEPVQLPAIKPEKFTPYIKAYMQAAEAKKKKRVEIRSRLSDSGIVESSRTVTIDKVRRRRFPLALVALFSAIFIAVAVIGYLGNFYPEYVSVYERIADGGNKHVELTDPVEGALIEFLNVPGLSSYFYDDCLKNVEGEVSVISVIAIYALPFVVLLCLLSTLIILISAIAALCKKSVEKGYVRKKCRFGFLIILQLLFTIIIALTGVVWNNAGMPEFLDFFARKASFAYAGYGLYGILGLSVLSLIFYAMSYKKASAVFTAPLPEK